MARRRDYAAEYARRSERARELGYGSYYERRVRAGRPPSAEAPTGERLRLQRGHAGPADLEDLLRRGRVLILNQEPVGERDPKTGRYREVRVTAQLDDGSQRSFRLRGRQLEADRLRPLRQAAVGGGVDVYTNPSLDVLGFITDEDLEEPDLAWDELEESA